MENALECSLERQASEKHVVGPCNAQEKTHYAKQINSSFFFLSCFSSVYFLDFLGVLFYVHHSHLSYFLGFCFPKKKRSKRDDDMFTCDCFHVITFFTIYFFAFFQRFWNRFCCCCFVSRLMLAEPFSFCPLFLLRL